MEPIAIIGDAVAGRQLTVRRTLIKLTEDLSKHSFDAGELLQEVQENKYHLQWGFQTLGEYAATELNLKERKAQYLSRVIKICKECGVKRADFEPAGISKLRLITSLNPESTYFSKETHSNESMAEHIVALIAEAPELSTKEVEEKVNHLKGMDGEHAMLHKSYSVTKSAYDNTIKPALEQMRKLLGSKGRDDTGAAQEYPDGACIEYILRDWMNDPNNFLEDTDCSKDQIEIPTEESNVSRTDNQGSSAGAGTSLSVASEEAAQNTLQGPSVSLVIPTEI